MDKTDKMRKKRNWKLVLFAGLVLEVLFIFGVIYGGIHGGGTPLWQLLVCVGIAVWIYIAFLKQRSIDISKSVVEEKVKTHTLADYLREGILLIDANDCVLLINRVAAAVLDVSELDVLGKKLTDVLDEDAAAFFQTAQSGEVKTRVKGRDSAVHLSVIVLPPNQDDECNRIVYVRAVEDKPQETAVDVADERSVVEEVATGLRQVSGWAPADSSVAQARSAMTLRLFETELLMQQFLGRSLEPALINCGQVVHLVAEELQPLIDGMGHQLEIRCNDGDLMSMGGRDSLYVMLVQLISTAALASDNGKSITVQTANMGNHVGIAVTDEAPLPDGMSVDTVFHAPQACFDQTAWSAERRWGYASARQFVEWMGGTLTAQQSPEGGMRITVLLMDQSA